MPTKEVTGYRPGLPSLPCTRWDSKRDQVDVQYKRFSGRASCFQGRKGLILKLLLLCVIFLVGLIIGYSFRRRIQPLFGDSMMNSVQFFSNEHLKALRNRNKIESQVIGEQIKYLSQRVHLTATGENVHLGRILHNQLLSYGLKVLRKNYTVLVSYLNYMKPNKIILWDSNKKAIYTAKYRGKNDEFHVEFSPFSSWSPSGVVSGQPVYGNYGTEEDFKFLKNSNVTVDKNIVILRYSSHLSSAIVARNAENNGASAILFYADPAQFTTTFNNHFDVYPNARWLPGWSVVRSQLGNFLGDLLTPDLPAIDGMQRKSVNDCKHLFPSIPCLPISFDDAQALLQNMANPNNISIPSDFIGDLNVTYNVGPGYNSLRKNYSVSIQSNNEMIMRNISNVLGIIRGSQEPDRYIILGNHYDAWLTGAVDPVSGTVILQEIAKSLGQLSKSGWKPRRTIIIAHWDAAKQGFIGSVEWIQEMQKDLEQNIIVYIDVSSPVLGNYTIHATANPVLHDFLWDILQESRPWTDSSGVKNAYELWLRRCRYKDELSIPKIWSLEHSNSDKNGFIFLLGVPSFHLQLIPDSNKGNNIFPAHNSALDTFAYVSKFIDSSFLSHKRYGDIVIDLLLALSSSNKLPFRINKLGKYLEKEYQRLQLNIENKDLLHKFSLDTLQVTLLNFIKSSATIDLELEAVPNESFMRIRQLNDKIMGVSRAFIWYEDIPGHLKGQRNVLFGRTYLGNSIFPGIVQTFHDYLNQNTITNEKKVNRQISILSYCLKTADGILKLH